MIIEGLGSEKIRALRVVDKSDGKVRRSNYNAAVPDSQGWGVFWKTLDWMQTEGLVIRCGKTYVLTDEGMAMVKEAKRRRIR